MIRCKLGSEQELRIKQDLKKELLISLHAELLFIRKHAIEYIIMKC
jgi:hypothetical protein